MNRYICAYCGASTGSPYNGACNHSPFKQHEWIDGNKREFTCTWCQLKAGTPYGGSCNRSPHKTHKWS